MVRNLNRSIRLGLHLNIFSSVDDVLFLFIIEKLQRKKVFQIVLLWWCLLCATRIHMHIRAYTHIACIRRSGYLVNGVLQYYEVFVHFVVPRDAWAQTRSESIHHVIKNVLARRMLLLWCNWNDNTDKEKYANPSIFNWNTRMCVWFLSLFVGELHCWRNPCCDGQEAEHP